MGLPIDVIYIDFEKAFYKVQHNLLIDKMEVVGVRGQLLKWFESYLSKRKQRVKLQESYSSWFVSQSGVPQASVLGPILFLLYTFDSPSHSVHSVFKLDDLTHIASFADDTKLYCQPNSLNGYSSLIDSLSDMANWSQLNFMPINLKKCQVLHMGKSLQYSIESHSIVNISVAKDLGVWVDKKLKFSDHIARITSCANRLIEHLTNSSYHILSIPKNSLEYFQHAITFLL